MRHSPTPKFRELVAQAVRLVGSQKALAEKLGCSQQQISFLMTHASEISAEDAIGIHRATGGKVPASALRPDLWRCPEHVPVHGDGDTCPAE
jgi:DNA-binding transcriptional regulator YdaS (Cro superfamily)